MDKSEEMRYTVLTSKSSLGSFLNDAPFKPARKWKHSLNQPLWQRQKLVMSTLVTPGMYQPLSVLPNTIHSLSARVQGRGHHETELEQPVQNLKW